MPSARRVDGAADVVRRALRDSGAEWEESPGPRFTVVLPGTRKLATTCSLRLGEHALSVNAFVVRRPEDDPAAVHRWLLERNVALRGVAFALDRFGDVYLTAALPLEAVTEQQVDRLLGSVLQAADESFDALLALGFARSIRAEWEWRLRRGEPTTNLEAFRHLLEPGGGAQPSPERGADAEPSGEPFRDPR